MKKSINLIFKEKDKKIRVDAFINNKEKSLSRTGIKKIILDRKLKINNKIIINVSHKLKYGDVVNLEVPRPKKILLKPYNYKLDIVYEDDDLLVLNKSAGISIHPGAGNYTNTIVNAKLASVHRFTSLKLFLIKTPIIKRNIIVNDKNNSGNI